MAISQNGSLARDDNESPVMGGTSSSDNATIINSSFNPSTRRLLVDVAGGSGTVTSVSVVTANGFAGTVANPTTTPAITLSTTITGILQGNGTAISAASTTGSGNVVLATAPTLTGATLTTSSVNGVTLTTGGGTTTFLNANGAYSTPTAGSGDVVGPASATDNAIVRFDGTTGKLVQNSAATIADTSGDVTAGKYNGLTITGSTGTLTIANGKTLTVSNTLTFTGTDSSSVAFGAGGTVLYGNQSISLTGDVTGSGATSIATTLATVNSNVGSFGSATQVGTFTVNGKGLTTAAANVTITPAVGSITGLGTGVATWLATPSSANLATAVTDETGSGALVFATSPTLGGSPVFGDAAHVQYTIPTVDGTATGETTNQFNAGYTTALGDLVYLDSSATWQKADADAASTSTNLLGLALQGSITSGNPLIVLLNGYAYMATAFPTMTIGVPMYVGETAGAIQAAIPTGADNVIRVIGHAIHADKIRFNPSQDWQVTIA